LEELRNISIKEANTIKNDKKIDLIVYVAKAGFPIAFYMNEIFDVPMLGIAAQRKGNKLKQLLGPLVSLFPRIVRDTLITFELKSHVHKKDATRCVYFHESINEINANEISTILVVDDSVDTGNSMRIVYDKLRETFTKALIVSYSLNVWKQSKEVFVTDYCSFENTVIRTPMSKDSKEYSIFCDMYNKNSQNGYL